MRIPQIITYAVASGERNAEHRTKKGKQIIKTMMQALELLWFVKRQVSSQSDVEQ